jgi:hypothetical protein
MLRRLCWYLAVVYANGLLDTNKYTNKTIGTAWNIVAVDWMFLEGN